jgi:hypothetical protein
MPVVAHAVGACQWASGHCARAGRANQQMWCCWLRYRSRARAMRSARPAAGREIKGRPAPWEGALT